MVFNHSNSIDPHIKFTMEAPGNGGSISLLNTKCSPNSAHTIHTCVYRKPIHTDCCLDWNSNHPVSTKTAIIHALMYRANNVCCSAEVLAKEINYLHRVLLKSNYPDWMIKETEEKPATPIINPDTGLKVKKNVFISVPYASSLSEAFRKTFWHTSVKVICKGANTLISILMYPNYNSPSQLKQNIV